MSRRDSCVICNRSITDSVAGIEGYRICRHCDVTWCLAEDPADPAGEWDKDYYGRHDIIELHESRRSGMVAIVERLSAICPMRGRLLDVGTGLGIFMHVAAQNGWSVEGVEPSKTAAERARTLTHAPVHIGLLEEINLSAGHYDAISIVDILRTVPDPIALLSSARRLLRPGGIMLVRESDRRMESAFRWVRGHAYRKSIGTTRRALTFAQVFSPKSLIHALERTGLDAWVEPSPVFLEPQPEPTSTYSLARRVVGMASTAVYKASARRVIISPNLLAFGRNSNGLGAVRLDHAVSM